MSSLHIDELYFGNEVIIPNETLSYNTNTRYRSYAVTDALNQAYADFKSGGGTGSRKVYSCSTCPGTCSKRGWKYVKCVNNGTHCTCDTGPTQKCNLTGAICKANNPRATSCSVRTYTNGSCVCDCKTGTGQNLTPPAAPGTVRSVSKPVSSTTLRPGIVPSAPITANTKFGSYDIAALKAQPPDVHGETVASVARAGELYKLQYLQTVEGQELFRTTKKLEGLEKQMRAAPDAKTKIARRLEIEATIPAHLEAYRKWKATSIARAATASPDLTEAIIPGAKKAVTGVPGAVSAKGELSALVNKQIPTPGNIAGGFAGFATDGILGCVTGKCPTPQEMGNSAIGNFLGPLAGQVTGTVGTQAGPALGTAGKAAEKVIGRSQSSFNLAVDFGFTLQRLVSGGLESLGVSPPGTVVS